MPSKIFSKHMKKLTYQVENKKRSFRMTYLAAAWAAILMLSGSSSVLAQSVWNGASTASSNWSDAANWGGTAIISGNTATFSGTARRTNVNDVASLTLPSVNLT